MASEKLAEVDERGVYTLVDRVQHWALERYGGYSTELVDDQMVVVAFRFAPRYNQITVRNADFFALDKIEQMKSRYSHYVYADSKSVFPSLV